MKKWLSRIGMILLLIVFALIALVLWNDWDKQIPTGRVKNDTLSIIKPGWEGNLIDQRGRFINEEFPFLPKTRELLTWQLSRNKFSEEKQNDMSRLEIRDPSAFLEGEQDGILWLGHASFFIRLNGVSILTDPIFDDPRFLRRYVDVPSQLQKIGKVDHVLVSHDHRDHADESSLRMIAEKFPSATFVSGLRMDDILNQWKSPSNPIKTAGWFQQYDTGDSPVKIYFVPVRHWSRRGLFDTNRRLWGSFVIQSDTATIYFGGDSGYGGHYREIGKLFPEIDYFLIGIGAYEPRWFMEPNHNNPADVVKAFRDSGAHRLVPMHYGTFDLSDEPPGQPLQFLLNEANAAGISDKVRVLAINEDLAIQGR
jgi:L-ascorbate metabolism protein UlaG (beta-lactamase superfamily)